MRGLIHLLVFFYRLVGWKLAVLGLWLLGAALFEGLGLGLFLPILEGGDASSPMGEAIARAFRAVGLDPSFTNILILMVVFFFLRSGFLILQQMHVGRMTADLLVDLRCGLVDKVFRSDYRYFIKRDVGYLNNAVLVEYEKVSTSFQVFTAVLVEFGFAIMMIVLALLVDPVITVGAALIGAPAWLLIRRINVKTTGHSITTSVESARLQELLIQALHHFKYLKSTFGHRGVLGNIHQASNRLGDLRYRQAVLTAIAGHAFAPFTIVVVAGFLYYHTVFLGKQVLEILFLLFVLKRAMDNVLGVQLTYQKLLGLIGSIYVFETLEREVMQNQEGLRPGAEVPDLEQPIRFRNVTFSYGDGRPVLKALDLEIPPRTTVAVVGDSGAGKSTLVTLLTGILRPTEGEILLGDKSYESLDMELLRRSIGYVTQESVIFNDTVRNNITLWEDGPSDQVVAEAARRAHIHEFVGSLPLGYASPLGDNGVNISGGQRQRVSIARELLKEVKLLILDEATSALDSDSEQEILKNIEEFRGEKTIVVVAHRLSTVRNSDEIFVLRDGQIVERGTYDELYELNGEFKRMVDLQALSSDQGDKRRSLKRVL